MVALARRHQNPTSAPPCEPPRHRNRAGATRSSLVKKRARRHQKATSAPPCEPHTAQKPWRGYPVIACQDAALADIKKRRLRHPTAQKPCRGYPVVVGQESGHSQTSKSDVCAPAPRRITTHIQTQVVITLVCLAG